MNGVVPSDTTGEYECAVAVKVSPQFIHHLSLPPIKKANTRLQENQGFVRYKNKDGHVSESQTNFTATTGTASPKT